MRGGDFTRFKLNSTLVTGLEEDNGVFSSLKSKLGYRWHIYRTNREYWTVESGQGDGLCAIGDRRIVTHFSRYFLEPKSGIKVRRGWHARGAGRWVDQMSTRYGLVVADPRIPLKSPLRGVEIRWPSSVELQVPLAGSWAEYERGLISSAKSDLRRVRRAGFRFVESRDLTLLRQFYDQHHVPSMRARHGDGGYVGDWTEFSNLLTQGGEWFQVWKGSEWVGGYLASVTEDGYRLRRFGWKNGDANLRRNGIIVACYVFGIRRAIEMGKSTLWLGSAPAYLEDGLMRFKAKWGARLAPANARSPIWRAVLDPNHRTCVRFFQRRSLMVPDSASGTFDVFSGRSLARGEVPGKLSYDMGKWVNPGEVTAPRNW